MLRVSVNDAKRHHLVPKFYLRRFSADEMVVLVSRDDLKRRIPTNIENALVQRYFYSLESDEGKDPAIERMLDTEVESPASRAIRRVVDSGKSVKLPGLRRAISRFLAFQFVRGAATREAYVEQYRALVRHIGSIATPEMVQRELERQGELITKEEAEGIVDFAKGGNYQVDVNPKSNLHLASALPNALDVIPFFEKRRWILLEFDKPRLVTSDEPIALIGDSRAVGEPLGLGNASEVVFATDPRHALVLVRQDKGSSEGRLTGTPAMADLINRHVAFNAHRYVVCHPECIPLNGTTLPDKARPVMDLGNHVVTQSRVSERARREWLKKYHSGRSH